MFWLHKQNKAGEGNRTPINCLEGSSFTTKLHPHEANQR